MARLYVLLFLVQIALAVCALISCLSAEEGAIRGLPRFAWALVILFFPLVGAIAWFLAGRQRPAGGPGTPRSAAGGPRRPLAPDDDPEFLDSLAERARRQDAELFRRWEEDLRRREDDLRHREGDPPREENRPEV
ncbi:PLD nuclease N-terminal domain-containing protein [Micromonospora carbonacea]|uniref:Phospholipase_D-nuclease N-terminal n=1 Tax=Micromonospora carbonacea TaxID=47853 RepID=A0A1C4W5H5_9ACTN|nr:PLD nuclease N-terminal domain-containing protein [Micromonospora carbonacea]SCE91470.1 Phospholipase_D-nuclease N-terminal [Micromonospora carbonacea]